MAFTHTKKVDKESFIKAKSESEYGPRRPDPDPTKNVRVRPDPQRHERVPQHARQHVNFGRGKTWGPYNYKSFFNLVSYYLCFIFIV
jgi:hypothetical protein